MTKRELLVRSGRLASAAGEEELVAYYMTHMNASHEHDFTKSDGSSFGEGERISFSPEFYNHLRTHPQYLAKKEADEVSYVWDRLVEQFTTNMLAGTTIIPEGKPYVISDLEQGVRHMALVPRYKRRLFGAAILDALGKSDEAPRFTRALLPGPDDADRETGFFFLTLAIPDFELEGGYEGYREVRRKFLEIYALALLEKNRHLKRVVGIGTEPQSKKGRTGSSEDMVAVEVDSWSPEFLNDLDQWKKELNIFQEGHFKTYAPRFHGEFPIVPTASYGEKNSQQLNRKKRRALAAKRRKRR